MTRPFDAERIYLTDKRSAEICTRMQIAGFAFDQHRAAEIAAYLRELEAAARRGAEDAVGRRLAPTKSGGFKTKDLEAAFFDELSAPVLFRSNLTGAPSLGVDSLRAYAGSHNESLRKLSLALLEWRRARKIRSTYVEGAPVNPTTGRVHPVWQNYGAVSGRWSCQSPNLQNLPRADTDPTAKEFGGGVRSLYRAKPGFVLVIFDYSQLEVRVAAYATGDEAMIAATKSSDVHAANATLLFGEAFTGSDDPVARKQLRTLAKSAVFAICYGASAETVFARIIASGIEIQLRQVEMMLRKLKRGYRVYYRTQDAWLLDAVRTAYVYTPILRRRRWVGHDPSPTECYNFPIQGGAADLVNLRMPIYEDRLALDHPSATIVAQVHDSVVTEAPEASADRIVALNREVFEAPVVIDSSGRSLEAVFPIDVDVSERWH